MSCALLIQLDTSGPPHLFCEWRNVMKIYLVLCFCWAVLLGGLVTSCDKTTLPPDHGGGGGGGGGSGGGGGNPLGGSDGVDCLPADVFVGSDGCYHPDSSCCHDTNDVDLSSHCAEAFGPTYSAAYLCSTMPGFFGGGLTDYRACAVIETTSIDCSWGLSTVLCCELM